MICEKTNKKPELKTCKELCNKPCLRMELETRFITDKYESKYNKYRK